MAKTPSRTKGSGDKATPTFYVHLIGVAIRPESIPLRTVSEALSAVQDLASGRDPLETRRVPPDKVIGLVRVRGGSAIYACVSHAPKEAKTNLAGVGLLLATPDQPPVEDDGLMAALRPIETLSDIARSLKCKIEVTLFGKQRPEFVVEKDAYDRLSTNLFLKGDTTVVGEIKRVGGATGMRCLLRVPGRRRLLYCNIETKEVARQLGHHLYERIAATGTATWIHRTWRLYRFTIRGFTQPSLGDPNKAVEELRKAGLSAWDKIADPDAFIKESRS